MKLVFSNLIVQKDKKNIGEEVLDTNARGETFVTKKSLITWKCKLH